MTRFKNPGRLKIHELWKVNFITYLAKADHKFLQVISDPLSQGTDGQTTCVNTMIPPDRNCGLAEWINFKVKKVRLVGQSQVFNHRRSILQSNLRKTSILKSRGEKNPLVFNLVCIDHLNGHFSTFFNSISFGQDKRVWF